MRYRRRAGEDHRCRVGIAQGLAVALHLLIVSPHGPRAMGCGTKVSPSATKNADGPLRGAGDSAARSWVVIATDDIGLARLRIRQPAFNVGSHRVHDVRELVMLFHEPGHHRTHGDDPQPGVTGGLQRRVDENRCQTAPTEFVEHLGVREDPLAVAIGVLGEADLLSVDGNAEAVGFLGDGRGCAGLIGCPNSTSVASRCGRLCGMKSGRRRRTNPALAPVAPTIKTRTVPVVRPGRSCAAARAACG